MENTKKETAIASPEEWFRSIVMEYGFQAKILPGVFLLVAQDTDGEWQKWMEFHLAPTNRVVLMGNTDNCNLWFCDTRKDLTPERIIAFVQELNEFSEKHCDTTVKLRELVDPEDWQELALVRDASEDIRYTTN